MADNESSTVTDQSAFYECLAHQIEREDALVNTRLSWMLTTQGLLFTAFALISNQNVKPDIYSFMKLLLPSTGISISVIAFIGVLGARFALGDLKGLWQINDQNFPRPFGNRIASFLGGIPSLLLPFVFITIWIIILSKLPEVTPPARVENNLLP